MKRSIQATLFTLAAGMFLSSVTVSAMAETQWEKNHPRRTEVNHRLKKQDRRIHHEVKDGQITKTQAEALHKDDHQIRQEERDMASQNGGHITQQEKSTLNHQENAVSQTIGK
jgi:hypothetical protein